MNKIKVQITALLFTLLSMTTGAVLAKSPAKDPSLVQVAQSVNASGLYANEFDVLLMLAGMDEEILETLTSKGQHTLFAPTDTAFDTLFSVAAANCIALSKETVNAVLKYHVAKGRRDSGEVLDSDRVQTLLGASFAQTGGVITDNAGQMANFVENDIEASNGIIHAIDTVLLPFPVENSCS